jgi:hypothetical protein
MQRMSKPESSPGPSTSPLARRKLFAAGGTAGALAAVAAALPLVRREADPVAATPAPESNEGGYRVTAHVLRYYETTRV